MNNDFTLALNSAEAYKNNLVFLMDKLLKSFKMTVIFLERLVFVD